MDYSPYQSRSRRSKNQGGNISIALFLLSSFVGFLLFWGIKTLFFSQEGMLSSVHYNDHSSRAEIMIQGDSSWGPLRGGDIVTPGDKVRIKKGNTGELVLENGSKLVLGLGSRVKMGEIRASEEKEITGELFLEEGPILLNLKPPFGDEDLKIWISSDVFLQASAGKILFEKSGVAVISGEGLHVQKVDSEGKVRYSKKIGVAQYLSIDEFFIQGIPEKMKVNPLVAQDFPASGVEKEADPVEPKASEGSLIDLKSPSITLPASHGEIVEVSKTTSIEGTAPDGVSKVIIVFSDTNGNSDEYELKNFSRGDESWKYIASPNYDNLSEGRNVYKVYSVTESGEKSAPATIVLDYTVPESANQLFSSSKGKLIITAPNNGNTTTQSKRVITLKGTAPLNARYITVVNRTLGTEYTLQGFKKGDTTWSYWTGNMDNGKYDYFIKAEDYQKRTISSDSISVTITSATSNSEKPKSDNTESPSPVVESSTPEVSR